jgi:DNA polymerase-3 subunit delta'
LEEPPEYATIILVVSNESKMLATIRSRCISIKFNKLSNDEIKTKFRDLSDEKIKLLEGSLKNVDTIEQKQKEAFVCRACCFPWR